VKYMGWPDHHNPPLELLLKVVHAMDEWLEGHSTNVAVVHCKVFRLPRNLVLCFSRISSKKATITMNVN
jgi:hypothetical protein